MGIDIKDEMLIKAKEKIESSYRLLNQKTNNIRIMAHEIMLIHKILNEQDIVSRIYINFCNPWHKNYHKARRLTHPRQLLQYKTFLSKNGCIWFKTDDTMLFNESKKYFADSGFLLII